MSYIAASATAAGRRDRELSSRWLVAMLSAAAVTAWTVSILLATTLRVEGFVHTIALIAHILAMVVAFGAILTLDWHGLLWLLGRRQLAETIRLDGAATPIIWGGMAGLLVTGIFLNPNTANPLTVIKLVAVLVLMVNGIALIPLMRRLVENSPTATFGQLKAGQRFHLLAGLTVSQLSWWTAIVIGFINAEF
jgi:hypothetical protein